MKPLRKRHLQIWTISAWLLPAGIVFAWLAIPNQQPVKLLQSPDLSLLPVIKQTRDFNDYTINIRTNNNNTGWQLEWKNKTLLKLPSAVIYRIHPASSAKVEPDISFEPGNAELIGRIETRGDYVFPLSQDGAGFGSLRFILYDFIHEKIIDSINFKL